MIWWKKLILSVKLLWAWNSYSSNNTRVSVLLQEALTDIAQLVAVDEVARAEYYKKYKID